MVRVLSVYNFTRQYVQRLEEVVATCPAPPDRLLIAGASHNIELRDMRNGAEPILSFPSVDDVQQIIHCQNGDFIATIESKHTQNNKILHYARVYVNWDTSASSQKSTLCKISGSEYGLIQPMRARIAGHVTPSSNQSDNSSLEMIELSTKATPHRISCCQMSGNILLASSTILTVYKFVVRLHDASQKKFIDFEELPIFIDISVDPVAMSISENYIACMNEQSFHCFKLLSTCNQHPAKDYSPAEYFPDVDVVPGPINESIDLEALLELEQKGDISVTLKLPGICGRTILNMCPTDVSHMTAIVKSHTTEDAKNYNIKNVLQLKLLPLMLEGSLRQVVEDFKCMVLKPIYTKLAPVGNCMHIPDGCTCSKNPLKSKYNIDFAGVSCLVATQQEGYLYHFNENDNKSKSLNSHCLAVYPFTSPVSQVVIEDCALHALTDAGLESYTLRIGHQLVRSSEYITNISKACQNHDEPICLIGLRPFLGVKQLLCTGKQIVLLASSDISPADPTESYHSSHWTLYSLELPTAVSLYNDIHSLALMHKITSPNTYCHLMQEAHVIIRLAHELKKYSMDEENCIRFLKPISKSDLLLDNTYKECCLLLGDYYITCSEKEKYELAILYYNLAPASIQEVFIRARNIQIDTNQSSNIAGLLYYLTYSISTLTVSLESDKLFSASSEHMIGGHGPRGFADSMLTLLSKYAPHQVSYFVIESVVLRDYATDKLIAVLEEQDFNSCNLVALALLYVQKGMLEKAENKLVGISGEDLFEIIFKKADLFFEFKKSDSCVQIVDTFTEFTQTLMRVAPEVVAEVFEYYIDTQFSMFVIPFAFSDLFLLFMKYMRNKLHREAKDAYIVLTNILENYFKEHFTSQVKEALQEYEIWALQTLIRFYISKINYPTVIHNEIFLELEYSTSESGESDNNEGINGSIELCIYGCNKTRNRCFHKTSRKDANLFKTFRHSYLDLLPPFVEDGSSKPHINILNMLMKLQSLLCIEILPSAVIDEIVDLLLRSPNCFGYASLRSCTSEINDGIDFLVSHFPSVLLQFAKDRFLDSPKEWTYLLKSMHSKICSLKEDIEVSQDNLESHELLHNDILEYLARNNNLGKFLMILPRYKTEDQPLFEITAVEGCTDFEICNYWKNEKFIDNYEKYITICKERTHANYILSLIKSSGEQLSKLKY